MEDTRGREKTPYQRKRERDEEKRKDDGSNMSDGERLKSNSTLKSYVDKKDLTKEDFLTLQKKINYSDQILIFRQRSLKALQKSLEKKNPKFFTSAEKKAIKKLNQLKEAEVKKVVDTARAFETSDAAPNNVRRSARIRELQEKQSGKGKPRVLRGYTIL